MERTATSPSKVRAQRQQDEQAGEDEVAVSAPGLHHGRGAAGMPDGADGGGRRGRRADRGYPHQGPRDPVTAARDAALAPGRRRTRDRCHVPS